MLLKTDLLVIHSQVYRFLVAKFLDEVCLWKFFQGGRATAMFYGISMLSEPAGTISRKMWGIRFMTFRCPILFFRPGTIDTGM